MRIRHGLGWALAVLIGGAGLLSVVPDLLSPVSDSLALSARFPFAQLISLRSLLAVLIGGVALIFAVVAAVRLIRREGGARTATVAVILVASTLAHAWILNDRGLDTSARVEAGGEPVVDPADWDGELTVLVFNTYFEEGDRDALAAAVRDAGADVIVLPETDTGYAISLAENLTQDGLAFNVFSSLGEATSGTPVNAETGGNSDAPAPEPAPAGGATPEATAEATGQETPGAGATAEASTGSGTGSGTDSDTDATTVLVSTALGDYERAERPAGLGKGNLLLLPVGQEPTAQRPAIMGVHTIAPTVGQRDAWRASVRAALAPCRDGGAGATPTPHLVIAGDFNATLDNHPMKDRGPCVDAAQLTGTGGLATWSTRTGTPYLGATIDHVLVDPGSWRPVASQVLDIPGSDHRALIVELAAA